MRVDLHAEALKEYKEAAHYYARQKVDLDLRFVAHAEEALRSIAEHPKRWGFFDENVRCCQVRVFPYRVLYT